MPVIENLLLSIGAMKAATSWLYMMLREHPQIEAVPLKEVHYFAHHHTPHRMLDFPNRLDRLREVAATLPADRPDEARAMLAWFRAYLSDPVDDRWLAGLYHAPLGPGWCAEFSNLNADLPEAGWAHVRHVARRVRVLYTLRNPLERLWSHTRFHLAFIGGLDQLSEWGEAEFRAFLARPEIADHARYARVLARLREHFAPEEYRVLIHDEIAATPAAVLAEVAALLGIPAMPHDAAHLAERHNPGPLHLMPTAFVAAARPVIVRELEGLEEAGVETPQVWRLV